MTKRQKPPVKADRSEVAVFIVLSVQLFLLAFPLLAKSAKDRFWEQADVSGVVKAVRLQRGGVPSELECEQLIRLNLKHIYFNTLDTDRLIGMPKPDKVLERISKVFSLAAELKSDLAEAQQMSSDQQAALPQQRRAVKKIHDCATEIRHTFHDFFKEESTGSFSVELPPATDERERFVEYVATCGRISTLLDHELERYFLNPSPGIVEVSTFKSCSIYILSLSLERLSLSFEKSLLN